MERLRHSTNPPEMSLKLILEKWGNATKTESLLRKFVIFTLLTLSGVTRCTWGPWMLESPGSRNRLLEFNVSWRECGI